MEKRNLTSPSIVSEILAVHGLRLQKSFGQNFLIDNNIRRKILDAAQVSKSDVILEIGPGIGTLSQEIAPKSKKLWLIELDKRLIEVLSDTLSEYGNVETKQADALKVDFESLRPRPNKVISNLPYSIAAPLIVEMLEKYPFIESYTVMIQEEMARRITASPKTKEYGALGVKIAFLADVKYLFKVSENVFYPKPKIQSAVIGIKRKDTKSDDFLFNLIESAFAYRRKSIQKALILSGYDKNIIARALIEAKIEKSTRAEELSLDRFTELSVAISCV